MKANKVEDQGEEKNWGYSEGWNVMKRKSNVEGKMIRKR